MEMKNVQELKIGDTVNYFGMIAKVIALDKSHVVIKFERGTTICTNKNMFE